MKMTEEQLSKLRGLIDAHAEGKITRAEMNARSAEVFHPEDPGAQAPQRSGLVRPIETAARVPGVDVPIGPDEIDAN
jgi:hypothetical protein